MLTDEGGALRRTGSPTFSAPAAFSSAVGLRPTRDPFPAVLWLSWWLRRSQILTDGGETPTARTQGNQNGLKARGSPATRYITPLVRNLEREEPHLAGVRQLTRTPAAECGQSSLYPAHYLFPGFLDGA